MQRQEAEKQVAEGTEPCLLLRLLSLPLLLQNPVPLGVRGTILILLLLLRFFFRHGRLLERILLDYSAAVGLHVHAAVRLRRGAFARLGVVCMR